MADTDRRQAALSGGPAIVLVEPQLGENIGMVARAMLNCGLTELRLVRPRDGWPNPAAEAAASGALEVIEGARLFDDTAAAIADLQRVLITTARSRGMTKPVVTPRQAAARLRAAAAQGQSIGVVFGAERSGLSNEDVVLGEAIIQVPLNPAFQSLNLAQAVLLVAYEWLQAAEAAPHATPAAPMAPRAERGVLIGFLERLEAELHAVGYFFPPEKTPAMQRNLRNIFTRADLTDQEVRSLQGVVSALRGAKLRRAPEEGEGQA